MTKYLTDDNVRFHFMRFPSFLLSSDLNETCQILYMLLLDRSGLSRKNGWSDEEGHVFVYYSIQKLAKDLHKSPTTIKDSLRKLENHDLICRVRQSVPKPTRIYVKIPEEALIEKRPAGISAYHGTEIRPIKGQDSDLQTVRIPATSHNKGIKKRKTDYYNYECGGNTL